MIYNEILHSSIKEWTINTHDTWKNFKIIMLSERQQILKKGIYHMVSFIQNSKKCKLIFNMSNTIRGCLGPREMWELQRYKETFGDDDEYASYFYCGYILMNIFICQNLPNCTF